MKRNFVLFPLVAACLLFSLLVTSCREAEPKPAPVTTDASATDPVTTAPTETDPPTTTAKQETDPPATEPPVTDPPVTDPPVTDPPVTDPPVTDPPATNPPVTEPPAIEWSHTIPILGQYTCYKTFSPWRDGIDVEPPVTIIESRKEVENILFSKISLYNLNYVHDGELDSVRTRYERYDDAWFRENALITATVAFTYVHDAIDEGGETSSLRMKALLSETLPFGKELRVAADGKLYIVLDRDIEKKMTAETFAKVRSSTKDLRFEVILEVAKAELDKLEELPKTKIIHYEG